MKFPPTCLLAFIVLLHGAFSTFGKRPNVVLIVSDDQGYRDLGCFGSEEVKTPHLDRLAEGGIKLTSFYVTWPACTPSRGSLLTGRYPQRNGIYDMIRNEAPDYGYKYKPGEYEATFEVHQGDIIDTIVDERSANTSDSFSNVFQLSLADTKTGTTQTWKSKEDFRGPSKPLKYTVGAPLVDQAVFAWQLAYVRQPTREELGLAADFLKEQLTLLAGQRNENPVRQAMTNFCQALISSNEFLYSD